MRHSGFPHGRPYADTDYPIVLEAVKKSGEPCIVPVAYALANAGIQWPDLTVRDQQADMVDAAILRAWREAGVHPKKEE